MGATCSDPKADKEGQVVVQGPGLKEASGEIEKRIHDLESWIQKADKDAKMWAAKAATDPSAKGRALRSLKQKKQYEQHRDKLLGTHYNVENVQFQQEQAEVTLLAARAMQTGHERLKYQKERMGSAEQIEQLQDDMQDLAAELKDAQDALARDDATGELGGEDFEAEFKRLEAEMAGERLAAEAQAAEVLLPGVPVSIHGLTGAKQLNGQEGLLEEFDHSCGRWRVRMKSGGVKAVLPQNLRQVASYSAAAPTAPARATSERRRQPIRA